MDKVCLQCGYEGCANAFVHCVKCLEFVVHRYCLAKIPETLDEFVLWYCDDCEVEAQSSSSLQSICNVVSPTSGDAVLEGVNEISEETELNELSAAETGVQGSDGKQLQLCDGHELGLVAHEETWNEYPLVESEGTNYENATERSPPSLEEEVKMDEPNLILSAPKKIVGSVPTESIMDIDQCRFPDESDTQLVPVECQILSCIGKLKKKKKKKRIIASSEATKNKSPGGSSQNEENKELNLENGHADNFAGGKSIDTRNEHKEEEKALTNLIKTADLSDVMKKLKKRTSVVKPVACEEYCSDNRYIENSEKKGHVISSKVNVDGNAIEQSSSPSLEEEVEKGKENLILSACKKIMKKKGSAPAEFIMDIDQCRCPDGSATQHVTVECQMRSGNGKSKKKKKRIVGSSEAVENESKASVGSSQHQEHKELDLENVYVDHFTEGKGIDTRSEHKEEEKDTANLIKDAKLSDGKKKLKKRTSSVVKTLFYGKGCSDNGSIGKSEKKRHVMSSEANEDGQRHTDGFAQTCEENKNPAELEKKWSDVSNEESSICIRKDHNDKAVDGPKETMKKKRSEVTESAKEKDYCGSRNKADSKNCTEDNLILSSLKSSKKITFMGLEADVEKEGHKNDLAQIGNKNGEHNSVKQFADMSAIERRERSPSNGVLKEDKKKPLDNRKQHVKSSYIKEITKKISGAAKSTMEDRHRHGEALDTKLARHGEELDTKLAKVDCPTSSCNSGEKSLRKRMAMSDEVNFKKKRHRVGSAWTCEENKKLDLDKLYDELGTEGKDAGPSNDNHTEGKKKPFDNRKQVQSPNVKEITKKTSGAAKSTMEKEKHGYGEGSDTKLAKVDHPIFTCNGDVRSFKKTTVMSSEANVKEKKHRVGSARTCEENEKLDNLYDELGTEGNGVGPRNDDHKEEKKKPFDSLKQHTQSSNVKEITKKRSLAAKSTLEKDKHRHGEGSDTKVGKVGLQVGSPIPSCTGNVESSKKRTIMSSEANVKEKRYGVVSARICEENEKVDLDNPYDELGTEGNGEAPSNDHNENRKSEEQSSLPDNNSNLCPEFSKDTNIFPMSVVRSYPQPILTPVWRGAFDIWNRKYSFIDGLKAHVSSGADRKVYQTAQQFQRVLELEILPKSSIWPKSFQEKDPGADKIGLYFFPDATSVEKFDSLVGEMVENELAMRALVQNVELLIFTSDELPILHWRFQGKRYLWGVFKGKRSPQSNSEIVMHSDRSSS